MCGNNKKSRYLIEGRLEDVMALIQVLAFHKKTHRSQEGLDNTMSSIPISTDKWLHVAQEHPEFFRHNSESKFEFSLIARHGMPRNENGFKELPAEHVSTLLNSAIKLYEVQLKRSEFIYKFLPIIGIVVAGIFTLIGSSL